MDSTTETELLEPFRAQLDTARDVSRDANPSVEFLRPDEVIAYQPPEGAVLLGAHHVVRGATFVIGGAPGVGKSRASVALAVAGALEQPWFGMPTHRPFKTLILQNENGRLRLRDEFASLPVDQIRHRIRISPPPPYGFAFEQPDFHERFASACAEFNPDVVLIDPWNAAARDDKASDYLATFKAIRSIIPGGDAGPALGIIAHTRKPKHDERASGRGLLNLLAGSYVLASVPRSVFVLQPASEDPEDSRVVFTCCKNNDGPMGKPSAWERRNGLFEPVPDFDWQDFRGSGAGERKRNKIEADDLAKVFGNGAASMTRKRAKELLAEGTGAAPSACYLALSETGRFKDRLRETSDGLLSWIPT